MGRRVDWSFGPGHGPVSGVVNAAGAFYAATAVAEAATTLGAAVHPLSGVGAGLVTAVAAWRVSGTIYQPPPVRWFRAGCWLGAGLWSAWTLSGRLGSPGTPWSVPAIVTLALGTVAVALIGLGMRAAERRVEDREIAAARAAAEVAEVAEAGTAEGQANAIAAVWQNRIRDITRVEVRILGVEQWETGAGYTLHIELPADGTTIADIKRFEGNLAAAADLPPGCNVEILATDLGRRTILARVATVSRLGDDHHLPEVYTAETINNPVSLGIAADGSEVCVDLRYSCMVLIGQVDSGKSNQLHVITTGLVRCTDVLVWAIDISGNGRYPRLWVRAWHEGRAEAPAIDWIAPTADEAALMTLAAIEIINGRTAVYQERMAQAGDDKIMVAPDLPQIMILVDECKTLPSIVKEHLQTISDTGRGAGVRVVTCALEATANVIPKGLVTQARVRMAMRVTDEPQLQYLFDATWSRGRFDPASIPWKGSALVAEGPTAPQPIKGWRMDPTRIDRAAIAVDALRPELDPASVELGDTLSWTYRGDRGERITETMTGVYSDRWERTRNLVFPPASGARPPTPAPTPAAETPPAGPAAGTDLARALNRLTEATAAARAAADAAEAARREAPADQDLPPLEREPDWRIVEGWLSPPRADEAGRRKPPPRQRMRQLVADAGQAGIGPGTIHETLKSEGYPTSYPTVVDWLKKDLAAGIVEQPHGDRTPYVAGPRIGDPHARPGA